MPRISKERWIERKDGEVPQLAKRAVKAALKRSVASGQKVLIAEDGVLYELTKTGKTKLKTLAPARKVKLGKTFNIT